MERASSSEFQPELRMKKTRMSGDGSLPLSPRAGAASPPPTDDREGEVVIKFVNQDSQLAGITTIPESKRIYVECRNLSAFVPALLGKPGVVQQFKRLVHPSHHKPKMTQVLHEVSGSVNPGEVLALMGPSGSGKTTMLSIIGARAQRTMKVKGDVTFNGEMLTKRVKRKVGYVMQDDLLYESLTVYETLYFAAMLRLPRTMTRDEKIGRVNAVITALGLDHCRNTIVGGFFRRGISGGERKRASVGHELLIDPSLLLLDEPTSGLDSTTAMHLLQILRQLAQGGRTIITTIHQPSSRLYQQLDKLLLLSKGRAMYFGQAQQAVDYFERLKYRIPPRVNAADFLLDLARGEVGGEGRDGEESRKYLIECTTRYLAKNPMDGFDLERDEAELGAVIPANGHMDGGANGGMNGGANGMNGRSGYLPTIHSSTALTGDGRATSTKQRAANFAAKSSKFFIPYSESMKTVVGSEEEDDYRWGAPFLSQIHILFVRSLRTRRFQSLSTQDIVQYLIIAVLAGCFWLQKGQDDTLSAARNIMGLLFFELMFLSFRALFVSLFTFPDEQKHMLKERASGMYRLSAFYIARTASDLPMDLSIPTFFILIVYFMGGLRYNALAFFGNYGTVLLSMLVAQSLGLLLGSVVMNPKTAQAIASVVMLTIVLTGGFFVTDLAPWIGWLKWLSYIYYALGLLLYIEMDGGNRTIYSCSAVDENNVCVQTNPGSPSTDETCTPVNNLQQSLGILQDPASQGNAIRDGMVLLGFLIVLRIAVYVVLRRKTASF